MAGFNVKNSLYVDGAFIAGGGRLRGHSLAAATSVTFTGLVGLESRTVSVFCVGLDCGSFTVSSTGTVTVPFGNDTDGLFTVARIQSVDAENLDWGPLACDIDIFIDPDTITYTVPVAIGFAYTSKGKVLPPRVEGEVKSPRGTGLGKTNRVHQFAALVDSAIGVSFGPDFDNLYAAQFSDASGAALNKATVFNGVHHDTFNGDYSTDGAICWQISRPYPCNIIALTGFMDTEER